MELPIKRYFRQREPSALMDAMQSVILASVPVALLVIAKFKRANAEKDVKIKKLEAEAMAIKEIFHWNPKFGEVRCLAHSSSRHNKHPPNSRQRTARMLMPALSLMLSGVDSKTPSSK